MSRRTTVVWSAAIAAIILLLLAQGPVWAQDYRFEVVENESHLYMYGDGSILIVYDITFRPEPGSDPIDVVDVGLPNDSYSIPEVQASIDGAPVADVTSSPYVDDGVAVELGANAIQPGDTGTLHVEATVRDMFYQDTEDETYASIEFSPTWFDSSFVRGSTYLEVYFHFPPGVGPDEPRYHDEAFTDAYVEDDRVVYVWQDESASGSRQYTFGASLPKQYLAEGVVQKAPAFTIDFAACCSSPIWWFLLIGGGWLFFAIFGAYRQRQRKMEYLPPALAVEGTGVKRGLTAVEAAILLEAPLDRVMTMILFGLLKKGIVAVESQDPVRLQIRKPEPKDAKLWYYERRFLTAVEDDGKLDEKILREMVIDLIGDVNKKLTGFSRRETKAYYEDIAARAWKQVAAADTPEVLGERWSEGLEWTMLDHDWEDRTRDVFTGRPVVVPSWWWLYRPWSTGTGRVSPAGRTPSVPTPAGSGTPVTLPTLPGADFANTVVTGIENAANTVVSSVESFTGGVTQTTNPPPKPSSSSSRGGGYSCACACACAGCACACAGGGR